MADRGLSRSRAILIGNSRYRDPRLDDLPAVSCVRKMGELLVDDLCGWPKDRIESLVDIAAPHELARRIAEAIKDAQDVVLLYYVGHGLRTTKGQLALAVGDSDSDPTLRSHTAILYENVADILRGCPAATKLVILDCCHAELGNKANYVFQSGDDMAEAYPVDGLYFIGASRALEKAKTPVGGDLTYFTRAFLDTVRDGIPGAPPMLRLDQIFVKLRSRLVRSNLPEPVESGTRGAHQYPFARNAAARTSQPEWSGATVRVVGPPGPLREPRTDTEGSTLDAGRDAQARLSVRVTRLLDEAIDTAQSITDKHPWDVWREKALALLADALAATDPERAERLAQSMTPYYKSLALIRMALALAASDPDRALRLATLTKEQAWRVGLLGSVAEAVAATDPYRAARLFDEAETAARSSGGEMPSMLAHLANQLAASDPDRALRLVESIIRDAADHLAVSVVSALVCVAEAVAPADPRRAARLVKRAQRLAESMELENCKAAGLSSVAQALAATDPRRAARLFESAVLVAESITVELMKGHALGSVALALAATDPDRAEHLARSIPDATGMSCVMADLARALAATDPDRAEHLARSIPDASSMPSGLESYSKPAALSSVAKAVAITSFDRATRLLDEAERAARSMTRDHDRALALGDIARAWSYPHGQLATSPV